MAIGIYVVLPGSYRRSTDMSDRRNPYLILGVPYGASKAEAASAFAKATQRLRREPESLYGLEDLNWALHQVEQVHDDPESAIAIFRVPANPAVYAVGGYGLLRSEPTLFSRLSDPSGGHLRSDETGAAGAELLLHLLDEHGDCVTPAPPFVIAHKESNDRKTEE